MGILERNVGQNFWESIVCWRFGMSYVERQSSLHIAFIWGVYPVKVSKVKMKIDNKEIKMKWLTEATNMEIMHKEMRQQDIYQ